MKRTDVCIPELLCRPDDYPPDGGIHGLLSSLHFNIFLILLDTRKNLCLAPAAEIADLPQAAPVFLQKLHQLTDCMISCPLQTVI